MRLFQHRILLSIFRAPCPLGAIPPWVVCLVAFSIVNPASAVVVTVPLSNFLVFSGGGLSIGGHNLVNGQIGSNLDLGITGPTQINGSVYVGDDLTVGSNSAIGSDGVTPGPDLVSGARFVSPAVYPALLTEVIANDEAQILGGTTVYGNLFADDVDLGNGTAIAKVAGSGGNVEFTTSFSLGGGSVAGTTTTPSTKSFGAIALTSGVSFTATGPNQQVDSGLDFLQLAPGPSNTYGSLSTSEQTQTVRLSSGDYYFSSITAQGTFTLEVDLTSGQPIHLNIVGAATFGQDPILKVKGAGTGGLFVPIGQAPALAALIDWTLGGRFDLGGGDQNTWTSIFGGKVYSAYNGSGHGIVIDQRVDWYGTLHAFDTIDLADHSRFSFVPEPNSFTLTGMAAVALTFIARRKLRASSIGCRPFRLLKLQHSRQNT